MATITYIISLDRSQTTLPKKLLLFGSKIPDCPKGTKFITVNADLSQSQHFYFSTCGEKKKKGVFLSILGNRRCDFHYGRIWPAGPLCESTLSYFQLQV